MFEGNICDAIVVPTIESVILGFQWRQSGDSSSWQLCRSCSFSTIWSCEAELRRPSVSLTRRRLIRPGGFLEIGLCSQARLHLLPESIRESNFSCFSILNPPSQSPLDNFVPSPRSQAHLRLSCAVAACSWLCTAATADAYLETDAKKRVVIPLMDLNTCLAFV